MAKRTIEVTPGNLSILPAKVGMVVISLFLVFGLVFAYVVLSDLPDSEVSLQLLIGAFFLIWVVACLAILRVFARISSRSGTPEDKSLFTVVHEDTDPSAPSAPGDFEVRLHKLERLKKDGVISESEYSAKREQIMRENW